MANRAREKSLPPDKPARMLHNRCIPPGECKAFAVPRESNLPDTPPHNRCGGNQCRAEQQRGPSVIRLENSTAGRAVQSIEQPACRPRGIKPLFFCKYNAANRLRYFERLFTRTRCDHIWSLMSVESLRALQLLIASHRETLENLPIYATMTKLSAKCPNINR